MSGECLTPDADGPESYGIEPGQPLILHGVKFGQSLSATYPVKAVIHRRDSRTAAPTWYRAHCANSWLTAVGGCRRPDGV